MSVGYTPWEIALGLIVFNKTIEEYTLIMAMRMRGRTSFIIIHIYLNNNRIGPQGHN